MTKRNANFWWWYPNSYPTDKGMHFSFANMNFALRFMRKFKTMPFELSKQYNYDKNHVLASQGRACYTIKMLKQDKPTKEQYAWLKRCNPDKKEKPVTFEEFKRGYKIYEGKKDDKGRTVWYIEGLDYYKGRGYQAYVADEKVTLWQLRQLFESKQKRGEL